MTEILHPEGAYEIVRFTWHDHETGDPSEPIEAGQKRRRSSVKVIQKGHEAPLEYQSEEGPDVEFKLNSKRVKTPKKPSSSAKPKARGRSKGRRVEGDETEQNEDSQQEESQTEDENSRNRSPSASIRERRWSVHHLPTPDDPVSCTRLHRKPSSPETFELAKAAALAAKQGRAMIQKASFSSKHVHEHDDMGDASETYDELHIQGKTIDFSSMEVNDDDDDEIQIMVRGGGGGATDRGAYARSRSMGGQRGASQGGVKKSSPQKTPAKRRTRSSRSNSKKNDDTEESSGQEEEEEEADVQAHGHSHSHGHGHSHSHGHHHAHDDGWGRWAFGTQERPDTDCARLHRKASIDLAAAAAAVAAAKEFEREKRNRRTTR